MTLSKHNPLSLKSWKSLVSKHKKNAEKKISDYFNEDPNRVDELAVIWESFYVDYSKNLLDKETINLLISMAQEAGLENAIKSYFE